MTLLSIAKIILEVTACVLLILGYIHEDQVIAFEKGLWQSFCDEVNYLIRQYERRKSNG